MFFSYLDSAKLDPSVVFIETQLPVYITMSTIPSRMANTFKIIRHTLDHVQGITKIILNIPWSYRRFPHFNVDLELRKHTATFGNDPRLVVNRFEDYGPITKLLPSLSLVPDESILIVCDDMCYRLQAFKDIAERQDHQRNKSFSYFVYVYGATGRAFGSAPEGSIKVPQGADMISFYTKTIRNFPEWFQDFAQKRSNNGDFFDSPCFFVDDLVIGYYLEDSGIGLEQVDPTHRMIYIKNCDMAPAMDNLNQQRGKNSRDNTMHGCYTTLRETPLGL